MCEAEKQCDGCKLFSRTHQEQNLSNNESYWMGYKHCSDGGFSDPVMATNCVVPDEFIPREDES